MIGMGSIPAWIWPNAGMLTAVGVYLWWRLVVGTTRPHSSARRIGTVVAVIVVLLAPLTLIGQYAMPMTAQRVIAWPGWLAYGLIVFLATATLLTEPVRIFWWFRRRRARLPAMRATDKPVAQDDPVAAPHSPDRRLFLQRAMAVGIGGVSLLTTGFAARSAVGGTNVRRVAIAIPGLPPEAVGMRIALVSDLHLGSVMGRDFC